MRIEFNVPGTPRPQGSKRHIGHGVMIESSKHVKNWRAVASLAALQAMAGAKPIQKPEAVAVHVHFIFERPKKHYNSKGLKADSPGLHTQTPDVDKLLRALLDSMTGIVFCDDAQVQVKEAFKFWGEVPQTQVLIETVR